MKISEILKITGGKLLTGARGVDIDLSKVSTDSRDIKRGEFFIGVRGPNYCGSLFAKDALKKGAIGAIVEPRDHSIECAGKILIRVKDALKAMQDIAAAHRAKFGIPVICVTGSNGKTTVKEMIADVLSSEYRVLKNEGTKNNHIGVPQTLLKLKSGHQICVLELGANHSGEIKTLSRIARPTVAVITNIGPSHLEYFVDLAGVCREKTRILDALKAGEAALINGDDPMLTKVRPGRFKLLRYGFDSCNDFRASDVSTAGFSLKFTVNGAEEYSLNLLGAHNIHNSLAAIAVARRFNVNARSIRKALLNFKPACMRLDHLRLKGISFINDSYNSNPASMGAALEAISAYPARAKWIVSGDMLELGRGAAHLHHIAGEHIAGSAVTGLLTFGKLSRHTLSGASARGMERKNLWHCATHDEIADTLKRIARSGDIVLIKGSRAMKMEKVIERMKG
ncbi:MAG: UDP-N-acetylmuramoyl-tripeptide--D-alanyl-D-alanine ligase [Candidatus Omnitrophica bacterium]|nr:UDP-N-acetylmuramoyl-tripeptide--D-alanyl-D-alanine ligase [Candidatus Omnitrophota bacterium]